MIEIATLSAGEFKEKVEEFFAGLGDDDRSILSWLCLLEAWAHDEFDNEEEKMRLRHWEAYNAKLKSQSALEQAHAYAKAVIRGRFDEAESRERA